jgi:hypothetical protein
LFELMLALIFFAFLLVTSFAILFVNTDSAYIAHCINFRHLCIVNVHVCIEFSIMYTCSEACSLQIMSKMQKRNYLK